MREFRAVKLKLKGPVTEVPHADTLFGAMANAIALLEGRKAVDELVEAFKGGARISSAFPYFEDTYYLPKPLTVELMEVQDIATAKRVRRASYLDLKNFEKALRLEPFEVPERGIHAKVDVPKVVLDRVTQDSSIYLWEEIRFRESAGLYFLYTGPRDVFEDFIEPAARLLGDTGIGGKSTWGFGLFEPKFERVKVRVPEGPFAITISNAIPTKEPILWRILRKSGWSFGRRKPKMTFISEGSVVRDDGGRFESLELGLPFRVYVYGLTFPIPTLIPEGLE